MCSLDDISSDLILLESQRQSLVNTLEKLQLHGGSSLVSSLSIQCQKLQELSRSIQSAIQTRFEELQSKENEVVNRLKEVELRENELGERLKLNDVSIGKGSSLLDLKFIVSTDGERLMMYLNEHENEHERLADEVYNALKMSDNPGKLVWQAVKWVFSEKRNFGVERNVERNSCLVLLEGLMRVRPEINKKVKKAATPAAKQWRPKIGMEGVDDMDILLFLMLVAAYGLLNLFNSNEIRSLFERVAQHKRASLLGRTLGFFEEAAPESCILHSHVKMEQLGEASDLMSEAADDTVVNVSYPSSVDLRFIASTGAHRLLKFLNEHGNDDKIGDDVYNALKMLAKPENLVLDVVKAGVSGKADVGAERGMVSNSCVILLEQLMRLRPAIRPKLRKKALNVAQQLKGNLKTQGNYHKEVLVFLMLVGIYGLTSEFDVKEIENLFESVSQHKQAPILSRILGFVDRTRVRGVHLSQVNIEQSEADKFQLDSFLPSEAKFEQYIASSSTSYWPELQSLCINMDAIGLVLFLSKHVEDHNLIRGELSNALQLAVDPAKFILDALPNFYRPKSEYGFRGLALTNVRKSCILLLEQLMTCSVQIESQVKEDALKLAVEWKEKKIEKYQGGMAYGFLQFIITYGLRSYFNVDELFRLLVTASKYRQSADLCLALGLADKISILIETLIKDNLRFEAIAYICAFDLADKFPPAHLLNDHLKYSKRRKYQKAKKSNCQTLNQTIDQEIAIIKQILRCIANHKLESLYPPENLENYILHLERQKNLGNDTAQTEQKKAERKEIFSVSSTMAKPLQENGIKLPCMNMSAQAAPNLSARAGCNLHLKSSSLEQSVSLIADQAAACSLWDSAASSVDINSFNWQHGHAISDNWSLEPFTSTDAVDKAAPEGSIHHAMVKFDEFQSENFQLGGFARLEARTDLQSYCTGMDARGLTLFLCEHVEDHDLMRCQISDALRLAPDPAKLVLDALSTFHYSKSEDAPKNKKNSGDDYNHNTLSKVRKSCILLLEQLRTFPLQIEADLNEEVLKLAVDWKIRTQKYKKSVMAYGLLQLIATYRLASSYDADELLGLLVLASEYRRSPDLCLALGLTDKIHVLIETLIKNNLLLEAIAYVCAFDLVDNFPPAHLLKVHMEYSMASLHLKGKKWHQIIDYEIAVLRKVIRCIADHKLELLYPPDVLEDNIMRLERRKAERNDAARKEKQKAGLKKTPKVPSTNSKPGHECRTKLCSTNVSGETVSSTSSSAAAGSAVKLSPLQLLESFFADQAVPNFLGLCTNLSAKTDLLSGKKQADTSLIADAGSSDSD